MKFEHFCEQHCALLEQNWPFAVQLATGLQTPFEQPCEQHSAFVVHAPPPGKHVFWHVKFLQFCEQQSLLWKHCWPSAVHMTCPQTPLLQFCEQHWSSVKHC